ncbi:hypothetical protein BKA93DRAFT_752846 [Sparassis latifolia]
MSCEAVMISEAISIKYLAPRPTLAPTANVHDDEKHTILDGLLWESAHHNQKQQDFVNKKRKECLEAKVSGPSKCAQVIGERSGNAPEGGSNNLSSSSRKKSKGKGKAKEAVLPADSAPSIPAPEGSTITSNQEKSVSMDDEDAEEGMCNGAGECLSFSPYGVLGTA